jgi:outer membrane protein TolC
MPILWVAQQIAWRTGEALMDLLNKTHLGRLAGGILLCCTAGLAFGADLQQCVNIALKQNPDILASQSQLAQAESALSQAQGQRLPKLTASVTGTRTNDALNAFGLKLSQRNATFNDFGISQFQGIGNVAPAALNYPDPVTNYNTRLELQIPLYNGGMISGYVDQAKAYIKAAQQGNQAARQQVIFHVIQAYQGVHTAHAYVNVAQQAEAAAEAYVKTTQNLLKEGVVVRSDLLFAQVNLANVRVNLEEARRSEAAAIDQLHLLLGLPLDEKLEIGPDFNQPRPSGNAQSTGRGRCRRESGGCRLLPAFECNCQTRLECTDIPTGSFLVHHSRCSLLEYIRYGCYQRFRGACGSIPGRIADQAQTG